MARAVVGKKRLSLDGEWSLLELSGFGAQYVQVYSFLYSLQYGSDGDEPDDLEGYRVLHAFQAFPWAGGWSAVDFYESLRVAVPKNHRPQIVAIEYASPGFIDLGVVLGTAWAISGIIRHICTSIDRINTTYNQIYSNAKERRLLRTNVRKAEIELGRAELQFADEAAERLGSEMAFRQMDQLRQVTANPVVRLKILMSLYRRLRHLAKLQNKGQIRF